MEFDIKQLIAIRTQGLNQLASDGISPEDVIFYVMNGQIGTCLVPFEGNFPPSYKYNARKQALTAMLDGTLSQELKSASRIIYFSVDNIYNVDYCFDINMSNKDITLYIVKDGDVVRRFRNYNINYDERDDISQL